MTEIDQREKLFSEFKESNSKLEEMRSRIYEHSQQLDLMHKEAADAEREFNFLRRTVHLVLVEDLDPIMAKFKVSDEMKNDRDKSPGVIGYTIVADEDRSYRRSKLRRIMRAIREIWNERY